MELLRLGKEDFEEWIPQLVKLHNQCFGPGITAEYFRWRYVGNPILGCYAHMFVDNGQAVAFHGASMLRLVYGGEVKPAAITINSMTMPGYGGQGLYGRVSNRMLDCLAEEGRCVAIGFPNTRSNRIHQIVMGYPAVYEVPMLEKVLGPDELERELTFDDQFQLDYTKIETDPQRIEVVKDAEYLRWRYACSPEAEYHNLVIARNGAAEAYAVCKTWRDRLNLVEFHANSQELARELEVDCRAYAKQIGCGYCTLWAPLNTPLHWMLEKLNYINRSPVHYFCAKPLGDVWNGVDVTDSRRWRLQLGDNNTY